MQDTNYPNLLVKLEKSVQDYEFLMTSTFKGSSDEKQYIQEIVNELKS